MAISLKKCTKVGRIVYDKPKRRLGPKDVSRILRTDFRAMVQTAEVFEDWLNYFDVLIGAVDRDFSWFRGERHPVFLGAPEDYLFRWVNEMADLAAELRRVANQNAPLIGKPFEHL